MGVGIGEPLPSNLENYIRFEQLHARYLIGRQDYRYIFN